MWGVFLLALNSPHWFKKVKIGEISLGVSKPLNSYLFSTILSTWLQLVKYLQLIIFFLFKFLLPVTEKYEFCKKISAHFVLLIIKMRWILYSVEFSVGFNTIQKIFKKYSYLLSCQKLDEKTNNIFNIFKNIIFVLNILGTICSSETVAPLAGQPRPSSASGTSNVHPYISNQDQLPQHQTDHHCVSMTASTSSPLHLRERTQSFCPVQTMKWFTEQTLPRPQCVLVWLKSQASSVVWREQVTGQTLSCSILYMRCESLVFLEYLRRKNGIIVNLSHHMSLVVWSYSDRIISLLSGY